MNDLVIECQGLSRTFGKGKLKTTVLSNVNLAVAAKERVAIVGASGSGKSTLLHLLGGLDQPDQGRIALVGEDLLLMNETQRTRFRNQKLGFIYQFHHLLPEFDAIENVSMPLWIAGKDKTQAKQDAIEMLKKVGLDHRLHHRPSELSGGERQRVAIARAMVHRPDIILADEPTGNLDTASANTVFDLMNELNQTLGTALLVVTHSKSLASQMDRVLHLEAQQIVA